MVERIWDIYPSKREVLTGHNCHQTFEGLRVDKELGLSIAASDGRSKEHHKVKNALKVELQ